jgi:microcystin degradation protein MlrC
MKRGTTGDLGRTALVRIGGVRLVLSERRVQNWDPEIFRCAGVEPTEQRIIVVKSVVHFRAAYEPLASLIVECDGPGITGLDLRRFPFRQVQRPIFGLDDM